MPRMNGLEATEAILERQPTPIIMVSPSPRKGQRLRSMPHRGHRLQTKNLVSSALDMMKVQDEFIGKVKAAA